MKTILMLLQAPFPPDIRLEKEIRSLHAAGYEVIVLCNQYEKGKSPQFPHAKIIRIKAHFKSIKLNKILNFPIFFNPRFLFTTIITFVKYKPDFLHAHDLPMMPLALILKFLFNKPVIFDMHENYPQALRAFKKKGVINFLFKNPLLAERIEKFSLKYSDQIIVVVEENKERLIQEKVNENKIVIVSNTVDLKTFKFLPQNKINDFPDKFILLYTGTVSPERGLETPVEAITIIKEKLPNILLLIIGDGKSVPELTELIKKRKIREFVKLIPWVGHENLGHYIMAADICIIPQPNNEFINTTVPHKLFEYMALSKPVLVSDAVPLKRIIDDTNAGLSFISGDPEDFANKVLQIAKSDMDYGKNGYNAVRKKYNWENDAKNLISQYENFKIKK